MSYGLEIYRGDGSLAVSVNDTLLNVVFRHTPGVGATGSVAMPGVSTVVGLTPVSVSLSDALPHRAWLTEPNILNFQNLPSFLGNSATAILVLPASV